MLIRERTFLNPAEPVRLGHHDRRGYMLTVSGHYAYVVDGTSISVIDIPDPANPKWESASVGKNQPSCGVRRVDAESRPARNCSAALCLKWHGSLF
jgi:hypothetical protein